MNETFEYVNCVHTHKELKKYCKDNWDIFDDRIKNVIEKVLNPPEETPFYSYYNYTEIAKTTISCSFYEREEIRELLRMLDNFCISLIHFDKEMYKKECQLIKEFHQ